MLTLRELGGQVRDLLGANMSPVEVIVRVLLIVTLGRAVIEGAAA